MSKTRLISALAASMCMLVAACWFVTSTFPLAAAPQVVSDAPGVSVEVGGATLLHRAPVAYPEGARAKGIQGAVSIELTLDGSGSVADARVLNGPEELRKAALQSVLQWHFAHETAGNKRQVAVRFELPAVSTPPAVTERPPVTRAEVTPSQPRPTRTIRSVQILGLSEDARNELTAKLPARAGSVLTPELMAATMRAVHEFDEHLNLMATPTPSPDEVTLTISAPDTAAPRFATVSDAQAIRVGGNVQATKIVQQQRPIYPPEAKAARIQGVVKLMAVIAKDGTMKHLEVISGHPLLVPAALEAVKNWVYQTTLLNGEPVDVQTQIDVNFTLSQ